MSTEVCWQRVTFTIFSKALANSRHKVINCLTSFPQLFMEDSRCDSSS